MTPLEKEFIEFQKAQVRVEAYDNVVMNKSFKGRTRGLWSGIILGLPSGVALGGLAAVLPALIGVAEFSSISAASVITSGAIGGAAGIAIGIFGGQVIGASASAAASAAAEKERREKTDSLEQQLSTHPDLPKMAAEYAAKKRAGTLDEQAPNHPNTLGEAWAQSKDFREFLSHLIVPKALVASVGFGMVLGAAMGLAAASGVSAPVLGPLLAHTGIEIPKLAAGEMIAANWPSIVAASSAIVGSVTAIFGLNYPMAFTSVADFTGRLLSGNLFEGKSSSIPSYTPSIPAVQTSHDSLSHTSCANLAMQTTKIASYSQMILEQKATQTSDGIVLH